MTGSQIWLQWLKSEWPRLRFRKSILFLSHSHDNESISHSHQSRSLAYSTLLSLSFSSYLYFSFLCWFSYFSSAALFGCLLFMKMDLSRRLFNAVDSSQKFWINVGFEPRTSDVGSNSSVNWAQLPYSLSHFSVSFGTFSIIIFYLFFSICFFSVFTHVYAFLTSPSRQSLKNTWSAGNQHYL